jgi:non-homologous end joining protein Ku
MASRPVWKGAIDFAGFPVNVEFHNRVQSESSDSFRMLGSNGEPVKQVLVESTEFKKLEKDPQAAVRTIGRNDVQKGVEIGDGYKALPAEALTAIASAERSVVVKPKALMPASEVPFELSKRSFVLRPDKKVPGADDAINILWNGLRKTGLAYTSEIVTKAGGRDFILVIFATADDLKAVGLPFAHELHDNPEFTFTENARAGNLFKQAVEEEYELEGTFNHNAYESASYKRRQKAIEQALAGETIKVPTAPTPSAQAEDMMSVLENMVAGAPKAKAAKKPATKKPASRSRKKVTA